MPIVQEEAERLLKQVERDGGQLSGEPFHTAWQEGLNRNLHVMTLRRECLPKCHECVI